jgi:hypothetical protein
MQQQQQHRQSLMTECKKVKADTLISLLPEAIIKILHVENLEVVSP